MFRTVNLGDISATDFKKFEATLEAERGHLDEDEEEDSMGAGIFTKIMTDQLGGTLPLNVDISFHLTIFINEYR